MGTSRVGGAVVTEPAAPAALGISRPPRMDTPAAAAAALQWGLATAIAQGARQISCVSAHFTCWPLNDPALLQTLTPWLRLPQRQLLLLAADFSTMGTRYPRFTQWRHNFVHAVPAWCCPPEWVHSLPEALFDDGPISVQIFDAETGRGRASVEPRHRLLLAQQTDAILQRSAATWPVRTLGL